MIRVQAPCLSGSVSARAGWVGDDLWVVIAGGDTPHIGSVSLAVPRKSLSGDGSDSAAVSTLNVTGHKDNVVGDRVAAHLAGIFRCVVTVNCGIHFDGIGPEELTVVGESVDMLLVAIGRSLRETRRAQSGRKSTPPAAGTRAESITRKE